MNKRNELQEVHGDKFTNNFDQAFGIKKKPSLKQVLLDKLHTLALKVINNSIIHQLFIILTR